MNPSLAIWPDAEALNKLQALDDPDEVLSGRRLRPITQPGERRAISAVADSDQCLQFGDRPLLNSLDEILVGLLSSAREPPDISMP
ncbi:hypothetical protein FM996_02490 [Methylosinus sporium]|uniref:Uncharacterized protein n=1 Tax=Methylosinus sporium TaxID=428 RepID=A0A549T688_METSR|nr:MULTISPECIES: hypothetical protein [Methylosinus]MBU3887070.1 hypothetical protein [Methylosinus sp. KRF6]TRL37389.1 hypothetical protein FM996_02490 [Methylosinus sporium]